jgi:catechol 2,3-dioxygenase-like lactoylglutathione lyase family enzyme
MIDHLSIRVSDFARSKDFFTRALAPLGYGLLFEHPISGAAFGRGFKPEAFYRAALAAGGRDNGGPGLSPEYHPDYFGAFVLDPDGHNIEAVCHAKP